MFNWAGMETPAVEAGAQRELPMVQIAISTLTMRDPAMILIVDLVHMILDPRIRLE